MAHWTLIRTEAVRLETPGRYIAAGFVPNGARGVIATSSSQGGLNAADVVSSNAIVAVDGGVWVDYTEHPSSRGSITFDWEPERAEARRRCTEVDVLSAAELAAIDLAWCAERRLPGSVPVYADATWTSRDKNYSELPEASDFGRPQELRRTTRTLDLPTSLMRTPVYRAEIADTGVAIFWWMQMDLVNPVDRDGFVLVETCIAASDSEDGWRAECGSGLGVDEPAGLLLGNSEMVHVYDAILLPMFALTSGDVTVVQQPPNRIGAVVLPEGPVELTTFDAQGNVTDRNN